MLLAPAVELVLRWVLGLSFVYVALHKIVSPADFAEVICGYDLAPDFSVNLIAVFLPFLELFFGAALILGVYPRSASLGVSIFLLIFILAFSINAVRGIEFDCGCFSTGQSTDAVGVVWLIIRDILYMIAGIYVLWFPYRRKWCVRQTGSCRHNNIVRRDGLTPEGV